MVDYEDVLVFDDNIDCSHWGTVTNPNPDANAGNSEAWSDVEYRLWGLVRKENKEYIY